MTPPTGLLIPLHFQGAVTFESTAFFSQNEVRTPDSTDAGKGGAIYNSITGTMTFKANLTANENIADV